VNDLKDLLERALADGHGPARHAAADPAGDLARGRQLLRRRTRYRALAATATAAAAAAAVVVPVALHGSPGQGTAGGAAAKGMTPASAVPTGTAVPAGRAAPAPVKVKVKLVAYTGAQPAGYEVTEIPAGWVIQGSDALVLTIAPANDADKQPDSFLGKLVVMQGEFSTADAASTGWAATTVGGRPAYFNPGQAGGGTVTAGLVIRQAPGRWLTIQAPASLGWTEAQFKEFALGVTILAAARPGQG
jgi:hypothetical protein